MLGGRGKVSKRGSEMYICVCACVCQREERENVTERKVPRD